MLVFCLEVDLDEEAKDAEGECCWMPAQELGMVRELAMVTLWKSEKQSSQPRTEERKPHGSRSSVPVDTATVLCDLPSRLPSCLLVIMEV